MKPMGPIPPGYAALDGELVIAGRKISGLIAAAGGTPLFVYDGEKVDAAIVRLRTALPPGVAVHYAMKANPHPPLVKRIARLAGGIDVASGGELRVALEAGAPATAISFAGPGKTDAELKQAIVAGVTLNLESLGEARRAATIGDRLGIPPRLAVRVNPDFDLKASGMRMGGGPRPFGVDVEAVPDVLALIETSGALFQGFHIFAGSQNLDADAIIDAQAKSIALAARLADDAAMPPPLVNLGGGFGIPYFAGDAALDVERIGAALSAALEARPAILAGTRFAVELGRWIVGEAGIYLTRIVDRKTSHGETFLITDGGMHHQLAASGNFGQVVRRNYPLAIATRFDAAPDEQASVVGCLCTPLDRLGDQLHLPHADVGDVVAVFLAGAYGATASPSAFLGHAPAREMLVG